jgi:hypothetical protein
MASRGSALLVLTFFTGTGAGLLLSKTKDADAPSSQKSEPDGRERWVKEPREPSNTAHGAPATPRGPQEILDHDPEEESDEGSLGRSFADVLRELEDAYQENSRLLLEEERQHELADDERVQDEPDGAGAEQVLEPEQQEARAESNNDRNAEGDTVDGDEPLNQVSVAARGTSNDEFVTEIQHGDRYSEQNIQQTVVVQNVSPVVFMNFGAGSVPTEETPISPSVPMDTYSSAAWASTSPSRTNPWAPIDYSAHHNPFSSVMSGRTQTLPPTGSSGLTVIYRR